MDVEGLLRSLNAHNVAYVVIGATAFPVHGYSRVTFDVDVFIRSTHRNAERTLAALKSFGYDTLDLTAQMLLTKKILLRQYTTEADIHPFVKGAEFEQVWRRKVRNKIGKTTAYFASLNDLIRMKKAAARAKDIEDLRALGKVWQKKMKRIRKATARRKSSALHKTRLAS
jgi:predicted nucleotidyltransferase